MKVVLATVFAFGCALAAPVENDEDLQRTKKSPSYGSPCAGSAPITPVALYLASAPQPQYREPEHKHEMKEPFERSYYENPGGLSGFPGVAASGSSGAGGYSVGGPTISGGGPTISGGGLTISGGGLTISGGAPISSYSRPTAASTGLALTGSNGATHNGYSGSTGPSAAPAGGANGATVGLFPNAKVGGCNVPLLLSCAPSVITGQLTESHAYSAPAYRNLEEELREVDWMLREASHHKVSEDFPDPNPGSHHIVSHDYPKPNVTRIAPTPASDIGSGKH